MTTEPTHEITLTQLRDFLESVEAGDTESVATWLKAAISLCEGGEWPEEIEETR